jgi:hypothetical protein
MELIMMKTDSSGTRYQGFADGTATSTNWTQLRGRYVLTVTGTLSNLTLYMEGPAGVNYYADDFVIELEWVLAPPPQATGWMAGSGAFGISFASQLGQVYRVERTDSLNPTAWTPVADGLEGTGYSIQVTNTGVPFPAQRFYRVVLVSP